MNDYHLTTKSPEETMELAQRIARQLKKGSIVTLHGELGSGKTTFVQGMVKGLGLKDMRVQSPTFVLMNIYEAKVPFYHFDLYRLETPQEILQIGYDDFFYGQGISVIEWADRLNNLYPAEYLKVELRHDVVHQREILVSAQGKFYENILKKLKADRS